MSWLFKPLASLRLTLVLLVLSVILVFIGTMAQEPLGLYLAQKRFFQSAFVDLASMTAAIKKTLQMVLIYLPPSTAADVLSAPYIPVYPGGYLLGGLLLVNLIAAHASRFRMSRKSAGILLVHSGIILLLLGQLFTDLLSNESAMRLTEGQTKQYSESDRRSELAVIEPGADKDRVVAIPDTMLASGATLQPPSLPFSLRIVRYYPNSILTNRVAVPDAPAVTAGPGTTYAPIELPRVTAMDVRDVPSALVEVVAPGEGSIGTFLLTEYLDRPQRVTHKDKTYELSLRLRRHYHDFQLTLQDFRHDKYPGTEIPKNFSSLVRLQNPKTGEDREVLIYMNNPLRYQGLTFYQASFDKFDDRVTILQVVRNPAWLTPYAACIMVGLGLLLQFGVHLLRFVRKPRTAPTSPTVTTGPGAGGALKPSASA